MKTKRPNVYDYLKILAIITMIIDHIGFLFYPEQLVRRIIGRTAFPLFLFLVGYNHSYKRRTSLWVRGILLQAFLWIGGWYGVISIWYVNILLAIGGTRVLMHLVQKYNIRIGEIFLFVLSLALARYTYTYVDYGTLSISFALLGYWVRKYGNTSYIKILILFSVSYHLVFMLYTRSFGEYAPLLMLIGIILYGSMYVMSKHNYSLLTTNKKYNQYIVTLSTYALEIYIAQAVLLGVLYLISMYLT